MTTYRVREARSDRVNWPTTEKTLVSMTGIAVMVA